MSCFISGLLWRCAQSAELVKLSTVASITQLDKPSVLRILGSVNVLLGGRYCLSELARTKRNACCCLQMSSCSLHSRAHATCNLLELLAGRSMCSVIGLWLNSVSIQYAAKSPSGLHPWGLLAVVFVS